MKKFLCFILIMALSLPMGVFVVYAEEINLKVNDIPVNVKCIEKDGIVYIPVRAFSDSIGYNVEWNDEMRSAILKSGDIKIEIGVGNSYTSRNGLKSSMAGENVIINSSLYMPVDALKAFNALYEVKDNVVNVEISVFEGKYIEIAHSSGNLMPEEGKTNDGVRIVTDNGEGGIDEWKAVSRGSNVYRFENKKTSRAMDVSGASNSAGAWILQYGITGGDNQNYKIENAENGKVRLVCAHSGLYVTVGEDGYVTQEEKRDDLSQIFTVNVTGAVESGVSADEEAEKTEPDNISGKFFNIEDKGVYKAVSQGEGKYVLRNKTTGKLLTKNGETDKLINADVFTKVNDTELKCGDYTVVLNVIDAANKGYSADEFAGKLFEVTNVKSGKMLSVENNSADNGANIVLDENKDEYDQWAFASSGDGYVLINKITNKAMDIPNHSMDADVQVTQYDANYGGNQTFVMYEGDNGAYFFKNLTSGLYITVKDNKIVQDYYNGKDEQAFTLEYKGESMKKNIGAAAMLFLLKGEEKVNNVKILWNEVGGVNRYEIFRTDKNGESFVTSTTGISVDDYNLTVGEEYTYTVYALNGENVVDYVTTETVVPYDLPADLKSTSNLEPSGLEIPNTLVDNNGIYYRFEQWGREDGGSGFGRMMVRTSTDDVTYSEAVEIMNISDILNHETCKDFEMARFESINYRYNSEKDLFIFVAHYEADGGYGTAMVSFATYKPSEGKMIFHGAYRPGGDDTRDLNVFVDDDNTAYVMAAVHGNANLAIYRLNDTWSGVEERIALINQNKWRELPNILKHDGIYYLFTSGCAGWYPTQGMYNSATSMEGPWSDLRRVGNTNTFSAQSGGVYLLNENGSNYIMNPYRWMYYWKDAIMRTTQSRRYPVKVSNGFAFYDFFEELLYNYEKDILIPVQRGTILSQEMPAGENEISFNNQANDGLYTTVWSTDTKWPYTWTVDLGREYNVNQVQTSWMIWHSSEAYYQYKIEGSTDGVNYYMLKDNTEGYSDYGFTVDNVSGKARYIKLTIVNARPRNSEDNPYPSQLHEVKILGN